MEQNSKLVDFDGLTQSQKDAVFHKDGPLLVLAGPGSGKTRVITFRIAALIRSGVNPYNICAITFTNKAAEEMRQRVNEMGLGRGVHVSTFHSLCVRILRQYAEYTGITKNFSIYDDSDQKRIIKEVLKESHFETSNFPPARMLNAISNCKNDLETPGQVEERADEYFTKTLAQVYRGYQDKLSDNNAMDFDDLLVKTAFLLRDHPEVRRQLSDRFRYLLVDEYQDTNHAQYQIAKGLALEHHNICVTGDPDQSIYRWRGADIHNILMFEEDWKDARVVKLEENFRSQPKILEMADKLIANNTKRKQKVLIPTREKGEDVVFNCLSDETEEAEYVAGCIERLMDEGADLNEVAVFYRVNSMSRVIEEAFVREQIPYQVVRGIEFYNRKEIRDMLGYMKLIANPEDNIAFTRAIGTHSRGIGQTTLNRLAAYAQSNRLGLFAAARRAVNIELIAKPTRGKLTAFAGMIDRFRDDMDGAVAPLMEKVFEQSGYSDYLHKAGEKEEGAIENVGELINAAAKYDEAANNPSLFDYLQTIALYSDTDAYDSRSGKVSLMTLHAAKGLEFNHAFIMGLEEGLLPHERSMGQNDEMEEERRLFFVGITRARNHLTITNARHRIIHGQFLRTTPSQFLYEIGISDSDFEADFEQESFESRMSTSFRIKDVPVKKTADYKVNELVQHGKFGLGRVKEYLDLGEDSIIVVRFNSGQTKTLMQKYAKLEKIHG